MKNYRLVFREIDRDKFYEIIAGRKTIETRAATIKYRRIVVGDTLTFVCGKDSTTKQVLKIQHFENLELMLSKIPLGKILPSANDINEAKSIYYSFHGYKEKIESEGILAFTLSQ